MKTHYVIGLHGEGADKMLKGIEQYKRWLDRKAKELARRLAEIGATRASLDFARAFYNGPSDAHVSVQQSGENSYTVRADGETVLFIEFGAGARYGYGHPEAAQFGMGPGTYPGKGHWDDPKGWYLPKSKVSAAGDKHSYGNPPGMPMYNARKEIEQNIESIVREVFAVG